jgi:hypothetical protein
MDQLLDRMFYVAAIDHPQLALLSAASAGALDHNVVILVFARQSAKCGPRRVFSSRGWSGCVRYPHVPNSRALVS